MTPAEMTVSQRRAHAAKLGRAVEKKYGLSGPQIGILRDAARKWVGYTATPVCGPPQLHDGQVSSYNVRQDSLDALRAKGFITTAYLYSDAEREKRAEKATRLMGDAFRTARTYEPKERLPLGAKEDGTYPAWKMVIKTLQEAEALLKGNEQKVTRITDAGREVAAEFKFAIGAEEE